MILEDCAEVTWVMRGVEGRVLKMFFQDSHPLFNLIFSKVLLWKDFADVTEVPQMTSHYCRFSEWS